METALQEHILKEHKKAKLFLTFCNVSTFTSAVRLYHSGSFVEFGSVGAEL